ncbi:MAG: hypothetical protein HN396_17605 [Gemmatimonadales bacterium]|nr:hypothetical protein [Gemmatimonadales bacterium]
MVDLSELGDVFVALGISQVVLFNGEGSSLELILLDPITGEDFTIPISEEAAYEISSRRAGVEPEEPEDPGEGRDDDPVERQTHEAPVSPAVQVGGGDAAEADQF